MNMTLPRRRLPCYPDSILVYAVAGTSSNLDLMKGDYAIDRDFQIERFLGMRDLFVFQATRSRKSLAKSNPDLTRYFHYPATCLGQ